jgi:serine/threonine protein kinase
LHDFELLSELGAGSFARVFLARQLSLGRQVALKISANHGTEARTLASLEHEHIVHVFSETVDEAQDLRLLCMQFVPGTTLERVLRALEQRPRSEWSGRAILNAIDSLSTHSAMFDPGALQDREFLGACSFVEAVSWIGTRLAQALAHAHSQGVLHRDIKPANILLNLYGRPFLADFNVSLDSRQVLERGRESLGGTIAYMAPEHLDAFNPQTGTPAEAVDRRSDIYSLGIVLYELLTGRQPFPLKLQSGDTLQTLREMAAERRAEVPSPRDRPDVPRVLERVIQRCLAPAPDQRYSTADDLAKALQGCQEMCSVKMALPPAGPVVRVALRHPFPMLLLLTLLPHCLASAVNITYNALRITTGLSEQQQQAFLYLVFGYNALVYPVAIWLCYRLTIPVYRTWRRLRESAAVTTEQATYARQRALRLPFWAMVLSLVGCLPGGLLFPLVLHAVAGPVPLQVFGHFLFSFTISGLIALVYSVFGVQLVVLRVLYQQLWSDARGLRARTRAELTSLDRPLRVLQLLAGSIPLLAAAVMLEAGPEDFSASSYRTFRWLVTGLIALGMAGFGAALTMSSRLAQTLTALVEGERQTRHLR